jgi:plasmid stabilization system protein ParE
MQTEESRVQAWLDAIQKGDAELPASHRLYFVGSHVIVYRDRDVSIAVVRILLQRMNLGRHV